MSDAVNRIVSDWLDGAEVENLEVAEVLSPESESCKQAAASLLVHGLLTDLQHRDDAAENERVDLVMAAIDAESPEPAKPTAASFSKRTRRVAYFTTAVSLAAVVVLMFILSGPQQHVAAAMASLEKVIETAKRPSDRSYLIQVIEEFPRDRRPKNFSRDAWNRESIEQIDGAKLHVRGPDKFVLVRSLIDGRERISGFDGKESWSFREDSPVHVSSSPERFRGKVPGQQQTLPFLDMHAHLTQLREDYDITFSRPQGERLSQLYGVRKSREVRGPKEVDIWFDETTGTVHRMVLYGLPLQRGGPKSVSLELIDQNDLGPDFFSHESHHVPDRKIKHEELPR